MFGLAEELRLEKLMRCLYTNVGVLGTNINFLSGFDGGVVRTNRVGLFVRLS